MKGKKWITPGMRISINQKAYLYRMYLNYPTERNKTIYKKYRKILTSVIRKAEAMFYQHLMDNKKKNFKASWEIFSSVINPKSTKAKKEINKITHKGKVFTCDKEIANALCDHFINVRKSNNKKKKKKLYCRTTEFQNY